MSFDRPAPRDRDDGDAVSRPTAHSGLTGERAGGRWVGVVTTLAVVACLVGAGVAGLNQAWGLTIVFVVLMFVAGGARTWLHERADSQRRGSVLPALQQEGFTASDQELAVDPGLRVHAHGDVRTRWRMDHQVNGWPVQIGDLEIRHAAPGRNPKVWHLSCVLVDLGRAVPTLSVVPNQQPEWLRSLSGSQITPADPQFTARYMAVADEPARAEPLLTGGLATMLADLDEDVRLETAGTTLAWITELQSAAGWERQISHAVRAADQLGS